MWEVFKHYESTKEVEIPSKLDKNGHRFGFVRFVGWNYRGPESMGQSASVQGISYDEAVKKLNRYDGSVLENANSPVTISSQILQYKSLAWPELSWVSDKDIVVEAAARRWEAMEKGLDLDEDKEIIASIQNAPITGNLLGIEQCNRVDPYVSPNRQTHNLSSLSGAEKRISEDLGREDLVKVGHEVRLVDSAAVWKALQNIGVVGTKADEWYKEEINRMEMRDKACKEGRDGGNHGQV
ncbi:hypothetical protein VNO78_09500 [Psophocarpus tetragonolobus]|uniref:Uncharacterized protein n=1 Tax=Psophocarpus tetragonolobus TaxID=3891 RepID=A0AAN9T864_PSOTE